MKDLSEQRSILSFFLQFGILFQLCGYTSAECKNGCSGHGHCSEFDMCLCFKDWQSNDCSERACPFGVAFVDTPKGDLDGSGSISSPDELVISNSELYPYGTWEQYPDMRDSDLNTVDDSAHYYSECSGAGECNKKTGECECAEGFEGHACQHIECPGEEYECSAHGTCHKLSTIAQKDYNSQYSLWSKDTLKGCICDKGWYGGDCSLRRCEYGLDPKYTDDDVQTYQIPSFFFTLLSTAATADWNNGVIGGMGYYRLQLFDQSGQGYYSNRISAGAACEEVVKALEDAPGSRILRGSVDCYSNSFTGKNPLSWEDRDDFALKYNSLYQYYFNSNTRDKPKEMYIRTKPAFAELGYRNSFDYNQSTDVLLTGDLYYLQFRGNIGDMGQPEVDLHSDVGGRPTVGSASGSVVADMWTNGEQGISHDYFGERCKDLRVRFRRLGRGKYYMWGPFLPDTLFECTGYSTGNPTDAEIFEGYDRGTREHPHAARLIRHVADNSAGGFHVLFYYDPDIVAYDSQNGVIDHYLFGNLRGGIRVLHPFHSLDDDDEVEYIMYTSKGGIAEMVGPASNAAFKFADNKIYMTNSSHDLFGTADDAGTFSCETLGIAKNAPSINKNCLDKNDHFFLVDPYNTENSPSYLNMYTAKSIRSQSPGDGWFRDGYNEDQSVGDQYNLTNTSHPRFNKASQYHRHVITTDLNTNWAHDAVTSEAKFRIYKFTPAEESTYTYVEECSNRGLCNTFEGVCECFSGYTGQACDIRHTLER